MITGSPATVRDRVDELLQLQRRRRGLMAMTNVHAFDDRLRSYELLAEAFRLEPEIDPAETTARGNGGDPRLTWSSPGAD